MTKPKEDIAREIDKTDRTVKKWKKEFAITADKVSQTEVKVTVTTNSQKQVKDKMSRQVNRRREHSWMIVA